MSDCVKCARLLSDYVDQQCDEEQREFVELHLSACPDCTARLSMLLSMLEVAAEASEPVPEGFSSVVMKRIDESKRSRFMPMRFTMVAAAAVALIFVWQLGMGNLPKGMTMMSAGDAAAPAASSYAASSPAAGTVGGGEVTLSEAPKEENAEGSASSDGNDNGIMKIQGFMGSNIARSFTTNSLLAEAPLASEDEDDVYLPVLESNNNGRYAFILLVQGSSLPADQLTVLFDGIPRFNEEGDAAVSYYLVSLEALDTLQLRLTEQELTVDSITLEIVSDDYPLLDEQAPYGAVVVY